MSKRRTLLDNYTEIVKVSLSLPSLTRAVVLVDNEIEAIRAEYEARIAYLEHQNDQMQSRIAVLEALSG